MDDRRVVAAAELLPDRGVGDVKFYAQHIHNDLPGFYDFFLTRFFVDAFLGDLVVARDAAHDFINGDAAARLHVVLDKRAHIGVRRRLALELRLAHDHIEHAFKFTDVSVHIFRDILDDVIGDGEAMLFDLRLDDRAAPPDIRLRYLRNHSRRKPALQ